MKNGRVVHSPLFLMRVEKGAPSTKFAAVASKKIAKTAVLRNKIQRKTYESVGSIIKKVLPGTRAILLAKAPAVTSDAKSTLSDIEQLFVKAGIIK
jgi:ribonuclease P protein component